jgi:hypothetical protein
MSIENILNEFPDFIPGARHVDKYFFRNSKAVLVHIRQVHTEPEMGDELYQELAKTNKEQADILRENSIELASKADKYEVVKVQDDLYSILDYIYSRNGIIDVYSEGFTPETVDLCNRSKSYMKKEVDMANLNLFREGKINIKAAETIETNSNAMQKLWERKSIYRDYDHIFTIREQKSLELITEDNPEIAYLVFGAAHDFYYAVKKWNRKNKKYSLIEITPWNVDYREDTSKKRNHRKLTEFRLNCLG